MAPHITADPIHRTENQMTKEELQKLDMILASGSPRRKEIMETHGHRPIILPMDVDETLPDGIAPDDAVMYLSLKKGLACEDALLGRSADPRLDSVSVDNALIVSADTIVYAYDIFSEKWCIMGKPADDDDAWRMLASIRGARHQVMTGVSLICPSQGIRRSFCDVTDVFVKEISDEDLKSYIDSGEPKGKAGGYAIQLGFGEYIDHIDGDYENVVGFPYEHFISEISRS